MSAKTDALLSDPRFRRALLGENSIRQVAQDFGVSFGFVQKCRSDLESLPDVEAQTETVTESSDGSKTVEAIRDRPVTLDDARDWIKASGDDPDDYRLSIRSIAYGKDMFSNRMSATPKISKESAPDAAAKVDWAGASRFVEDFTYVPARRDFLVDAAVLQPTDEQWGKTDFDGGTPQTEERVMNSYAGFVDFIREYRPRQVLLARTGDGIENVCNTPSQRDTNDLDLPAMLAQSFKMDLAGLKMMAPHAGEIINAYVPSNHGRWRTGLKAEAGNPHADFGIAVARQIQSVQATLGVFENVKTVVTDHHMESMTVKLDTINIGLVHGHQVNSPDRLGDWWGRQDHGRMPTWDADILLVGHFHSLRIQQSGDARWIFVGPASDNGSSWYSNLKGERSTSGMLAFTVEGKKWRHQEII